MKIRVVDTDSEFDALEESWNRLSDKTTPNFFSSFDYVRTAWEHFRGPNDRLYILVLSEGPSIVGIAPFYIHIERYGKWEIPYRTIRWIAMWEGDRPRLLVGENEEMCWIEIFRFLESQEHSWEVLDLVEQPMDGPEGRGWSFLPRFGWHWEKEPDTIDYYISLEGSWDDYLKGLGSETRNQWRRKARRLSSIPGGYVMERISDPKQMQMALDRFVRLERSGWKAEAGVGAGKDKRHLAFYEDLLVRLAGKGQATAHFLTSSREDVAGWICFNQRNVVYFRHTAYSPTYSAYSPGILIQAEVIQELFREAYRELDLLGMKEDGTVPRHKTEWATGRRKTIHLTAYRVRSRLLPLVIFKRLKRILTRRPAQI
jgi:CelD/BcsL family acetyltransferase involved in cellulose biosynthesis